MSDEKRDEKEVELFVHLLRCKTFESIADHPKTVSVRASAAWVFTDLDTVINSLQAVRDLARDSQRFSVRLHSARPTDRTEIRSDTSILADSKPALITDITDAVVKSGLSAIPGVVGRSAEFPLFVEVGVMRLYIHGLLKGLFGVTKIGTMFELNISEDHSILKLIAACDLPEFSLLEKSIFDRDPCAGESPLDGSLKLWRLCRGWKIERPLFLLAEPHTMYQKMKYSLRISFAFRHSAIVPDSNCLGQESFPGVSRNRIPSVGHDLCRSTHDLVSLAGQSSGGGVALVTSRTSPMVDEAAAVIEKSSSSSNLRQRQPHRMH